MERANRLYNLPLTKKPRFEEGDTTNKKVLSVAVVSLVIVSVSAIVSTASGDVSSNPIVQLLNSWFGAGGKYNNTPQVTTRSGSLLDETEGIDIVIGKVADVKITIMAIKVGPGEEVRFGYDIGKYPKGHSVEVLTTPVQTFEVCTDHFWIEINGMVDLYYDFIVTTEP